MIFIQLKKTRYRRREIIRTGVLLVINFCMKLVKRLLMLANCWNRILIVPYSKALEKGTIVSMRWYKAIAFSQLTNIFRKVT